MQWRCISTWDRHRAVVQILLLILSRVFKTKQNNIYVMSYIYRYMSSFFLTNQLFEINDPTIKTDTFLEENRKKIGFVRVGHFSGSDVCIRKYRQNWMDVVIVGLRNERKSSERLRIFYFRVTGRCSVRLQQLYVFKHFRKKDKWLLCKPALPKTILRKIVY